MSISVVRCEPKETGGRQFPLATLKVADITEGLADISRGFIMENSVPAENGQYKRLDDISSG